VEQFAKRTQLEGNTVPQVPVFLGASGLFQNITDGETKKIKEKKKGVNFRKNRKKNRKNDRGGLADGQQGKNTGGGLGYFTGGKLIWKKKLMQEGNPHEH